MFSLIAHSLHSVTSQARQWGQPSRSLEASPGVFTQGAMISDRSSKMLVSGGGSDGDGFERMREMVMVTDGE